MKVAIYARVSTDRQRERHTIASQLRELPEHAARQGWTVVETFKDDGRSGETVDGRPGFQRLLDAAGRKQFDAILVIDLDRITRSKRSVTDRPMRSACDRPSGSSRDRPGRAT